jgi:SAM-dependent methyltransferase
MDLLKHNQKAWNSLVKKEDRWTVPVSELVLKKAEQGVVKIVLTPKKPVPKRWLGPLKEKKVLCLASGGGQQGPVLAAAGARVTVFDNSDEQLNQDRRLSEQFKLGIKTIQGNMQNLGCFSDNYFDLIVHPVSNCFIDDILPVWKECFRVLKAGGSLLSGVCNPVSFLIDWDKSDNEKILEIKYSLPHSDLNVLSAEEKQKYIDENLPFEFGHTLTDQIQGQISAGFVITGFYEDKGDDLLDQYTDRFMAIRAEKR